MSYFIDIIDTLSPLVQIVPKSASSKGIVLKWSGSDAKDEKSIIGSDLSFDMLTVNDDDAAFIDFFTGDEHRFKTLVKDSVTNEIIWQGYILPDLYNEPYKAVNFFVSFGASDGLGRLKGKYLPAEYYSREKSIIDIFCQILRLTGLNLDLYFSPAIENAIEKDWNKIYIDTEAFLDGKKQKDAYKIFESLLADTLCICFQCDSRWYIEGINIRQTQKVTYKTYDSLGNALGLVVVDKVIKQITPLVTPNVTIIPPYNEVVVNYKKTAPSIPKTASAETNDGWAIVNGILGIIEASQWMANGDYYAKCLAPNYGVVAYNQFYFDNNNATDWAQDDTKFISLRKKIFFEQNQKISIAIDFLIVKINTNNSANGNVFKYEILQNGIVLYSNFGGLVEDREVLNFDDSGKAEIKIDHIFDNSGLFDIRIYRPTGRTSVNNCLGIQISSLEVKVIDFVDEIIETDLINGDFTIDKDVELVYGDDQSGFSNSFRLAKLKEETAFYNEIEVIVLYGTILNGKYYSVVSLSGADLINKNRYQVYYLGNLINILDVVFNFQNGEEMVIQTESPISTGSFFVRKYAVDDFTQDRSNWTQWTDAFYKIEKNSYTKTVANIYRRMFNAAHEKIDVTAKNAIKFNDVIQFKYQFLKNFTVLNCSWNLDENTSTLVLARAVYQDSAGVVVGQNISPIVVAANDIFIGEFDTTASISATAYDPDGFIASQNWTKITGDPGDSLDTPNQLAANLTNLTGDFYTYKIEVTDNSGATAFDTINITRVKNYTITLDLVEEFYEPGSAAMGSLLFVPRILRKKYKVNVNPNLPPNTVLNVTGEYFILADHSPAKGGSFEKNSSTITDFVLEKNGVNLVKKVECKASYHLKKEVKETGPLVFNIVSTDQIFVTLILMINAKAARPQIGGGPDFRDQYVSEASFKIQTAITSSLSIGNLTGVPVEVKSRLDNKS